jgi:hypothetical protein
MSPEARERSFDELARGLADNSISRGQAIKWAGYGVLGVALSSMGFAESAEALTRRFRRRCRAKGGVPLEKGTCHCAAPNCDTDFAQFVCGGRSDCTCELTVERRGFCTLDGNVGTGCSSSEECAGQNRCVVLRGCLGSGGQCTAATDCPADMGCVNGTCQNTWCTVPCPT